MAKKPQDIEVEPGADARRDAVLRRMLKTPPKPHKPAKKTAKRKGRK